MAAAAIIAGVVLLPQIGWSRSAATVTRSSTPAPALAPVDTDPDAPAALQTAPILRGENPGAAVRSRLAQSLTVTPTETVPATNLSSPATPPADAAEFVAPAATTAPTSTWSRAGIAQPSPDTTWGKALSVAPGGRYPSTGESVPAGAIAVWPAVGAITSVYGPSHPLGVDIGVSTGTPIRAMASGTVTFSGGDPCCSYGYRVDINHGNGVTTRYGHLVQPSVLRPGQSVRMGEVIGYSGSTGYSTGPHLHFEVRLFDRPVNPLLVLP
jgi:murein DD-endopeptidase MepM/ murein hydrolase activator NlpD